MRVIENNFKEDNQEYEITCPHCKSKLAYMFGDIISDGFDNEWIYCDACNKQIPIYKDDFPTVDKISYPKDFFSYEKGLHISDIEINKWIKECVDDLNQETDYSFRASGDTIVFAYKSDEDVPAATVMIAKKYQECDVKIPQKIF